jgi:hypothetical protein
MANIIIEFNIGGTGCKHIRIADSDDNTLKITHEKTISGADFNDGVLTQEGKLMKDIKDAINSNGLTVANKVQFKNVLEDINFNY